MRKISKTKRIITLAILVTCIISAVAVGTMIKTESEAETKSGNVNTLDTIQKHENKANGKKIKEKQFENPSVSNKSVGQEKKTSEITPKQKSDVKDKVSKANNNGIKTSNTIKEKKHIHSWNAVYGTKQVAHTKQVSWTKCYCCGADMTGNPTHIDMHLTNHESNVHYGTEYRTETYYTTESYISGYRCSCGTIK